MNHHALAKRRVPVLRSRRQLGVGMGMGVAMQTKMAMMTAPGLRGRNRGVVMVATAGRVMPRDRRRHRTVVGMMAPGGDRRPAHHGVMMMDARHGRCADASQRGQGYGGRERRPDERCHDIILCPGRAIVTTHARNVFNTIGTRPGKSSLIRPGPNASAQAA